ncbi:MAG: DUF63 family protein [Halalkalicoccus sp.]|nr:DUF63 family protein [Halalkalicoccus sp.]
MILPTGSVLAALFFTVLLWNSIKKYDPSIAEQTQVLGTLTVFGQVLDGITTMVGIDLLGFSEQVTLSRWIIETTAALPGATLFGTTWLFVLLKFALGAGIVVFVGRAENPDSVESRAILVIAMAAGLVPGFNNLLQMSV